MTATRLTHDGLFTCQIPDAKKPSRAYQGDAGYDLYNPATTHIKPGERRIIDTGISVAFPSGWYGLVQERGSQSVKGIFCIGNVVDEGFTGTIHVMLHNLGHQTIMIQRHEKIGQLILTPRYVDPDEHLLPTRGANKLGSSGNR